MHHEKERKVKLKLMEKIRGARLGDGECSCSSSNNRMGRRRKYLCCDMGDRYVPVVLFFGLTYVVKKSKQRKILRQDFGSGCEVYQAR